ncbi:MAG: NAD(P)/FAD-dependent oxidoreductase [Deltaproteobacteria bacterium]|nr:NAD(P)/FAD-dependent oxidoreductase [Deltaproteobacteria bacterium]
MKHLAILGAGTGGTTMANRLARRLSKTEWKITVIDRDLSHVYQPGLLFLPFGDARREDLVRDRTIFLPHEVELVLSPVDRIEADARSIRFADGRTLSYDLLIIATGTRIVPEATEGLTGPGWGKNAFDFYTLDGAAALGRALSEWPGGRLVLNVAEMPIKCPVAPLEFLFLADAFFTKRGLREAVELVYATPLDGAFTKPTASALLGGMLERRGIRVEPSFNVQAVDTEKKTLSSYDGRVLPYDLLVAIPPHQGSELIRRSGLGDDAGFVPTDPQRLRSKSYESIFVIGDATDLPASKAGSVAHFESEVLTENVLAAIEGRPLPTQFDGHANCFIETGFDKAMLIDFNYETEPLPGRFPLPGIGPFTLLEESHVNHWGKLGFKWAYWNMLLKGAELPIDHQMLLAGKWRSP